MLHLSLVSVVLIIKIIKLTENPQIYAKCFNNTVSSWKHVARNFQQKFFAEQNCARIQFYSLLNRHDSTDFAIW